MGEEEKIRALADRVIENIKKNHNPLDKHQGPLPWRLEIASRLLAGAFLEDNIITEGEASKWALEFADALIAAHEESK
jgi:hypothetical protein